MNKRKPRDRTIRPLKRRADGPQLNEARRAPVIASGSKGRLSIGRKLRVSAAKGATAGKGVLAYLQAGG